MHKRRPSSAVRTPGTVVVALLVALTGFVVGTPPPTAHASTGGSATAQAVNIDLAAIAGVFPGIQLISAVTNEPAANGTIVDNVIGVQPAGVSIGAVNNSATRGPTSTSATSTIANASVDLLGINLLSTGVLTAVVECPFPGAGPSQSEATAGNVSLLGQAVTVTSATATVTTSVAVADITAAIREIEVPGEAAAIVVTVTIDPIALPPVVVGDIVLAHVTCVAPTGLDAPTASSLDPTSGPQAGGNTVTLTGAGMLPGTSTILVTFPGGTTATVPAGSVTVGGAGTTASFQMPPSPLPGGGTVQAVNAGSASAALGYTFIAPPTATGIAPAQGSTAGGTAVTITGSGFVVGATTVTIGGAPAGSVSVVDATTLSATTPPGAAGPQPVVVTTTTGGASTTPLTFTYLAPPTATGITPPYGPVGGQLVTVTGTGFVPGTSATVAIPGGPPVTVPPASITLGGGGTTATFTMPDGVTPGPATVVLTNDGGSTAPLAFQYLGVPTATSLAPSSGPVLTPTSVTITGTGFAVGGTEVLITLPGAGAPTVIPATSVTVGGGGTTATFATPVAASPGAAAVAVRTPVGTSTPALTFTYLPVPAISSLAPPAGPTAGGTVVTVTGSGFVPGATTVSVDGGTPITPTSVTATSLTFTTLAHPVGGVPVTVTTPGGTSPSQTFTYLAAPAVTSIDPVAGPVAGGNPATVNGTGFVPGATTVVVTLPDGTTSPSITPTAVTPTTVQFTLPDGVTEGAATVTVVTDGGSAAVAYQYLAVPAISALAPSTGPDTGGTSVTVTGSGFVAGATAVSVDGGAPITPTGVTPTSLTFATPPHAVGGVPVTVTTAGGTSPARTFTYYAVPTATGLTPAAGPAAGGTLVTITGSGFVAGVTEVSIGGVPGGSVTVSAPTRLTFTTPGGAPGPVDVVVRTPGGASGPQPFEYLPAPTGVVAPAAGPLGGGNVVTVTGTNLDEGTVVTVTLPNGTVVTISPTLLTDTAITFPMPAGSTAGPALITVTTGGGALDLGYTYVQAPTATGVDPSIGPVAGGTAVTLSGTGFVPGATTIEVTLPDGTAVTVPAAAVVVAAAGTTATFLMPPSTGAGDATLAVATTGGQSGAVAYEYAPVPTAVRLEPDASGPVAGGDTVTVIGTGFVPGRTSIVIDDIVIPASAVTVGTAPAAPFGAARHVAAQHVPLVAPMAIATGTAATFVTPAHALGPVPVHVVTPGGTTAPPLTYTYVPTPLTVTGVVPPAGPLAGGNQVVISGTAFVPGRTTVAITQPAGGTVTLPASAVTVDAAGTTATFTMPASLLPGEATVTVSVDGVAGPPVTYRYVLGPTASGLSPSSGPPAGGTIVTISGSGMIPGATQVVVTLPDGTVITIPAAQLGIRTDGAALNVRMPASRRCGSATVRLVTAGGASAPLTYRYTGAGCSLPATGSSPGWSLSLAVVLVAAGWVLVAGGRRRARRAA